MHKAPAVISLFLSLCLQNKYNLAAETQITVRVEDENDNKPNFQEGLVGTVLENEPIGTSVMRVRAYDLDGTSPNNKVNSFYVHPYHNERIMLL